MAHDNDDPEESYQNARADARRGHEPVKQEDVHDDRSDQRERQGHKPIDEEENPRDQLNGKDEMEIVGGSERPNELAGDSRRRWCRQKMQKTIEPEDYKRESEQDASDQGHDLQDPFLLLRLWRGADLLFCRRDCRPVFRDAILTTIVVQEEFALHSGRFSTVRIGSRTS